MKKYMIKTMALLLFASVAISGCALPNHNRRGPDRNDRNHDRDHGRNDRDRHYNQPSGRY